MTDTWKSEVAHPPELEELTVVAHEVVLAKQRLHRYVWLLRDQRVTWAQIGAALNVSRQAAWQRFTPKRVD